MSISISSSDSANEPVMTPCGTTTLFRGEQEDYHQIMEDTFGSVGEITHRTSERRLTFSLISLALVAIVLGGYALWGGA